MNRRIATQPRRRTLATFSAAALLLLLVLVLVLVLLLLPASLSAFAIKWEHYVHQEITFDGLNPLEPMPQLGITAPKFELILDTGTKVKFSVGSINDIVFHNVATDDLQGPLVTSLHFDSENLKGGSDRLKRLRQQIVFNLVDAVFLEFANPASATERQVRVTNSRALLGRSLHTLQDFYAHTNWVEQHDFSLTEINTRLGTATEPSPSPGASCDSNEPELAPLTSGWFENDPPLYCGAPENKCAHGGLTCGIHKDFSSRTGFASAETLAIKATHEYTRQTLQAVLAGYTRLVPALGEVGARQAVRLAVCEFMGVPDPMSTCLTPYTLSVQKLNQADGSPTTGGLVESSGSSVSPAIVCGDICEGGVAAGSSVTLTAKDNGNWKFVRWAEGGACPGSTAPECSFTVTENQLAAPEFAFFDFVAPLSPKASFLRSDPGDPTLNPIVINLDEHGIVPGQVIELSSSGFYFVGTSLTDEDRRVNMVFSSSNELLSHNELHRVPGALSAAVIGLDTGTTCSSPTPLPTDIPEDFSVASPSFSGGSSPVVVTVPTGALYLFAGIFDCAYWDNSDPDGDLEITIKYSPD